MSDGGPGACRIVWWGHAAVEVTLDGVRLVTDPLLRRRVGPLHYRSPTSVADADGRLSVDAVLLSHLHRDHTDLPSLPRFPARTRVVVPAGPARWCGAGSRRRVEELAVGEHRRVGSVRSRRPGRTMTVDGAPADRTRRPSVSC